MEPTANAQSVVVRASFFLSLFRNLSESELLAHADDLLSFLYELHDRHQITASKSPRFSGRTFIILEPTLYLLESNPEKAVSNLSTRDFIIQVLEDIVTDRIKTTLKP